jgi:tetratricopeptide (TPR) repeat protein
LSGLEQKLGNIHALLGAWELAECHYQAALQAMPDPARQAWAYADWARTTFRRGEAERAFQLAHKSLELAQTSQDHRALVRAHNILGILERNRGNLDIATQHLEHSHQLAGSIGDTYAQAAALNNMALIQASRTNFSAAINLANQALELCLRQGDRHRAAALHNNLADFYHAQGEQDAAMYHLKQAAAMFSEIGVDDQTSQPEIWKLTEW